ncbi:MAG: CHASE domain-containing protein [Sterolibacterium sp.]|nr:CHASE domain-containing protein [Sterolibacterium sp.]
MTDPGTARPVDPAQAMSGLQTQALLRHLFRWMPGLVLLLSLAFTTLAWRNAQLSQQQYAQTQFDFQTREVLTRIEQRMRAYQQILLATRGLFDASQEVSRNDFRAFVNSLQLTEMYPGIQGVGYSLMIPANQLTQHIRSVRQQGFANYTVQPAGERDIYSSILFLEPFSGSNLHAFGYDMYAEPVRQAAMARARDTDQAALSGKVRLLQEGQLGDQAGTLIYLPIYRHDLPHATIAERRAALLGWVYAPFRMDDLMNGIQGGRSGDIDIEIHDGDSPQDTALLYGSYQENLTSDADKPPEENSPFKSIHTLQIAGHPWTVVSQPTPAFLQSMARQQPTYIGVTGLLFSGLLCWLTWILINGRRQALRIARDMTHELRESEERFRLLADSMPALIWLADTDRQLYWFNQPWLEFTGSQMTKEQHYGWADNIHPEDIKRYFDTYYSHFEQRQAFAIEFRLRHHDGDWRWVAAQGLPRFKNNDRQEEFIGYIGSCVDVNERKLMEKALQRSEENFRKQSQAMAEILWGADVGTWEWNIRTGQTIFNARWAEIIGYRLEELGNTTIATWQEFTHPDDLKRSDLQLQRCFRRETEAYECEARMRHSDGRWIWVLDRGRVVEWGEDGRPLRMSGTHLDITTRKLSESRLQLAANVFTHAREAIVIADPAGTIIDVNDAFTRITGYKREEALGNNPRMLQSGRHDADFYDEFWEVLLSKGHWSGEIWNRRKNGELYPTLMTISAVRDDNDRPQNYVALSTDITALKDYQRTLEHIAHYDVLTGLPNRALLANRMRHALTQCQRRNEMLAVVYLDLDGFKAVNDQHGHDVGDKLLMQVTARMQQALRQGDTLARVGGDEFIAVLIDLETVAHCEHVLKRLQQAAADPVTVQENTLQVSVSIGVALYSREGRSGTDGADGADGAAAMDCLTCTDPDQLIHHADQAMYQAKQAGRNCYRFYTASVADETAPR